MGNTMDKCSFSARKHVGFAQKKQKLRRPQDVLIQEKKKSIVHIGKVKDIVNLDKEIIIIWRKTAERLVDFVHVERKRQSYPEQESLLWLRSQQLLLLPRLQRLQPP